MPGTYWLAWTGHDVCHGFGTLEGWQLRTDVVYAEPNVTYTGYVFRPGDR